MSLVDQQDRQNATETLSLSPAASGAISDARHFVQMSIVYPRVPDYVSSIAISLL